MTRNHDVISQVVHPLEEVITLSLHLVLDAFPVSKGPQNVQTSLRRTLQAKTWKQTREKDVF